MIETGTKREDILMVNFDDNRFVEYNPKMLDLIFETYLEFLKPGKKPVVFLDDVHNVPLWERWVRTKQELGKARNICIGFFF